MSETNGTVAARLEEIFEEFGDLEPQERLELLLDFADELPPLPERFQAEMDTGEHRVHECQTEVHLWVEVQDGRVQLYTHVAEEAPTVKGFLGILVNAFSGASPQEILEVKPTLLQRLGLTEALGMVRMRGLSGVMNRVRREVEQASGNGAPQ